eukprot:s97_g9.t2
MLSLHTVHTGEGTWLCEIALWTQWWHRGQLAAQGAALYTYVDVAKFMRLVIETGGYSYMYLRTVGILMTAVMEDMMNGDAENDLSINEERQQEICERAFHFQQLARPVYWYAMHAPQGKFLTKDPWAEYGPSEIHQLEQDHATRIQDKFPDMGKGEQCNPKPSGQELRERAHHREDEFREASSPLPGLVALPFLESPFEGATSAFCRQELEAARIELTRQRSENMPKPAVEAKADCLRRSLMAPGGLRKALDATDAEGRVSRCLELARANKALLERLCLEQRESLLDPSESRS